MDAHPELNSIGSLRNRILPPQRSQSAPRVTQINQPDRDIEATLSGISAAMVGANVCMVAFSALSAVNPC
jgi:hypothetical protein